MTRGPCALLAQVLLALATHLALSQAGRPTQGLPLQRVLASPGVRKVLVVLVGGVLDAARGTGKHVAPEAREEASRLLIKVGWGLAGWSGGGQRAMAMTHAGFGFRLCYLAMIVHWVGTFV